MQKSDERPQLASVFINVITDSLYSRITMIPLSSSCVKLVYVLVFFRATRSLFWTLHSERCVRRPNYGNRALLSERSAERSDPKIGWSGAERWAGVAEKRWSGARSGGSRSGNGAGSGGYRIRLERGAAFSPAPLRSHALIKTLKTYKNFL